MKRKAYSANFNIFVSILIIFYHHATLATGSTATVAMSSSFPPTQSLPASTGATVSPTSFAAAVSPTSIGSSVDASNNACVCTTVYYQSLSTGMMSMNMSTPLSSASSVSVSPSSSPSAATSSMSPLSSALASLSSSINASPSSSAQASSAFASMPTAASVSLSPSSSMDASSMLLYAPQSSNLVIMSSADYSTTCYCPNNVVATPAAQPSPLPSLNMMSSSANPLPSLNMMSSSASPLPSLNANPASSLNMISSSANPLPSLNMMSSSANPLPSLNMMSSSANPLPSLNMMSSSASPLPSLNANPASSLNMISSSANPLPSLNMMSSSANPLQSLDIMSSSANPLPSLNMMSSSANPLPSLNMMSSSANPAPSSSVTSSSANPASSSSVMASSATPSSSSSVISSSASPASSSSVISSSASPASSSSVISSSASPASSSSVMASSATPASSSSVISSSASPASSSSVISSSASPASSSSVMSSLASPASSSSAMASSSSMRQSTDIMSSTPATVMMSSSINMISVSVTPTSSVVAVSTSIVVPRTPCILRVTLNNIAGIRASALSDLISGESIAISDDSSNGNGTFQVSSDGTTWNNLKAVSTSQAQVVQSSHFIRFSPTTGFHGAVSFNYSRVTDLSRTDVSGLETCLSILVIPPQEPSVVLSSNSTNFEKVISEDSACIYFPLKNYITALKPGNESVIPAQFASLINSTLVTAYQNDLNSFSQKYTPGYDIKTIDSDNGVWRRGNSTNSQRLQVGVYNADINVCFKPTSDYSGTATITVTPLLISSETSKQYASSATITITINVTAVNDKPELNLALVEAPLIAYNYSLIDSSGFLVSTLTGQTIGARSKVKVATDPEGSLPGIAIFSASPSSYGTWQFNSTGSWEAISVSNPADLTSVSEFKVVLLKPTDRLRFNLNGDQFWNVLEVTFQFLAWDKSDSLPSGNHTYNVTVSEPSALSTFSSPSTCIQSRLGCHGKAVDNKKTDAIKDLCGVCGGQNDTCVGCDGVVNSGAIYDDCFNCTGGTTGLVANFRVDCFGTCGLAINDSCGTCQLRSSIKNYTDCHGVCYGTADYNLCGQCVGGTTGKPLTYLMDACGVCNGDNSTCLDCAKVPNGGKVIDLCNKCLLPTDSNFNSECTVLGSFAPTVGHVTGGVMSLALKASGLATYKSVSCSFVGSSTTAARSSSFVTVKSKKESIAIVTPVSIKLGTYTVSCVLGSDAALTAKGTYMAVDESSMTVTKITPSVTAINTNATVVFTGSGFVNSSELVCLYQNAKTVLEATFISSTAVSCKVPAQTKSKVNNIYLSFVAYERTAKAGLSAKHYISVNSSQVVSARFNSRATAVLVNFDKQTQLFNSSIKCQDMFPHSFQKFGTKAKCKMSSDKIMKIKLIGAPTFAPELLYINLNAMKVKRAEYTLYPSTSQNFTVSGPLIAVVPKITLVGPSEVGVCDKIKLRVGVRGGDGGRKLQYAWSVHWSSDNTGSPSGIQTAALNSINTTLGNLQSTKRRYAVPANGSLIGATLTFKVVATNFFSSTGFSTVDVTRVNKNLPIVSLSSTKEVRKVSETFSIRAKGKLSECIGGSFAAKLTFKWTIQPFVDLAITDKPKLVIKKGLLKGGKTYTANVIVAMQQDPTLRVTQAVTIETISSPVVASIQGPQTVGADGTLVLDGSFSVDPDNDGGTTTYKWQVTNADQSVVIVNQRALKLSDGATLSVNVRQSLPSGKKYIFTLTYRVGDRTDTASQTVSVVPGAPPLIEIVPVTGKVNPSKKVAVQYKITSSTQCSFEWTTEVGSDSAKNYDTLDLSADQLVTPSSGNLKGVTKGALVLNSDVLSSDVYYVFRLTATNADDTASSIIEVKTNGMPSEGILTVSPTEGVALNTTFTMDASEGFTDPDGDPLNYIFGYKIASETLIFSAISDTQFQTQLPPGLLTIFVICVDSLDAFSTSYFATTINVTSAPLSDSALNDQKNQLENSFTTGDLSAVFSQSNAVMLAAGDEESSAKTAFQSGGTDMLISAQSGGSLQTTEAEDQSLGSMGKLTNGGSKNFDKKLIARLMGALESILVKSGGARRRRRSLSGSNAQEKEPSQVESALQNYVNTINPSEYDSNSQSSKQSFLSAIPSLAQSMCVNLFAGEPARVAKSSLAVITSITIELESVDTQYTDLGCNDCPTFMNATDKVMLGAEIKSSYSALVTICLTSYQMKNDLLSSSFNSSIMSSVVLLKLFNANTHDELTVSTLTTPVTLKISPTKATNKSYLCRRWDTGSSAWTQTYVETITVKAVVSGNTSYVSCNVTKLGYVVLFEGPVIVEPSVSTPVAQPTAGVNNTVATSAINATATSAVNATANTASASIKPTAASSAVMTTSAIVTTTLAPANYPRYVQFNFPLNNCSAVLTNATKANVTASVKSQIASVAKISAATMTKFNVSCGSLIVEYEQTHASNVTASGAVTAVQNAINNNLNVTVGGKTLTASSSSFKSTVILPSYATSKPPVTTDDDDLSDGAIAGIVIGVLIAVVIIVALIYIFCVKKNTRKDPTVEPNDNVLELRGKSNQGYNDSP